MRRWKIIMAVLLSSLWLGAVLPFPGRAQDAPKGKLIKSGIRLEGVWSFESLKNLQTGKVLTGRSGYLIFSKRYFSVLITGDQRKKLSPEHDLATLSREELLDLLQLTAGTGSYHIEGTTLVVKTLRHLRPEAVGTEIREAITLQGDTLKLTYPGLVNTGFYAKGDLIESTFKRVE